MIPLQHHFPARLWPTLFKKTEKKKGRKLVPRTNSPKFIQNRGKWCGEGIIFENDTRKWKTQISTGVFGFPISLILLHLDLDSRQLGKPNYSVQFARLRG